MRDAFGIASREVPVSAMAFVAAAKELPPVAVGSMPYTPAPEVG